MRPLTAASLPPARPRGRRPTPRWLRPAARCGAAALLLAVMGGGGFWLWRSGVAARSYADAAAAALQVSAGLGLRVGDVLVEGRNETRPEALRAALAVSRDMPLLAVDLAAAKARLEALPWVRVASVERRWPSLIYVKLEERTPLALWQHNGKIALVDRDGRVIERAEIRRFAQLPLVVGAGAAKQAPALLALLARQPALARHVQAAVWVGERRWNLHLQEGIDVRLPEGSPEAALARLAELEAKQRLFERDIVMVDLRLPDRLIVRLAPEAAQRQAKPGRST